MTDRQKISQSKVFLTIPEKKYHDKVLQLIQDCKTCSEKNIKTIEQAFDGLCEKCSIVSIAYNRYYAANIPFAYWDLDMKNFKGAQRLKNAYDNAVDNVADIYRNGSSVCLAGIHGCGKTMTLTNILKKISQKNYTCLYTTLSDIVNIILEAPIEDKFHARKELMVVDFLAIDEFDSRFVNEAGSDLFGKVLENVFRTRLQNKLPTLLATNSPNPIETFTGAFRASIDSLMASVQMIPIIGEDFRKQGIK